jgi:hypothetical protein
MLDDYVRQFFVALTWLAFVGSVTAHPIHDGEELGAIVRYVAGSDIRVNVTITPSVPFDRVDVELGSNSLGGKRVICALGAVVATQSYQCAVSGDVADHDPGLVINIIGYTSSPEHDVGIARKSFTIANPNYDRAADQRRQRQLVDQSSRNTILREPVRDERVK